MSGTEEWIVTASWISIGLCEQIRTNPPGLERISATGLRREHGGDAVEVVVDLGSSERTRSMLVERVGQGALAPLQQSPTGSGEAQSSIASINAARAKANDAEHDQRRAMIDELAQNLPFPRKAFA